MEALSHTFTVKALCEEAGVSRSGYYKWKKRGGRPPRDRERVLRLVQACHDEHPSHGYRWVHAYLKGKGKIGVSAEYVRRCFSFLGIRAETRHGPKARRGGPGRAFPNLIFSTWETVDRPRQVIVSDMTALWSKRTYFELVLYFDVFTKQIVGHGVGEGRGGRDHYYFGLLGAVRSVKSARKRALGELGVEEAEATVLHTDQGSVYTSLAYNELIREEAIWRSCSRPGKPTDNPVMESADGWVKEELAIDFGLGDAEIRDVPALIDRYVR